MGCFIENNFENVQVSSLFSKYNNLPFSIFLGPLLIQFFQKSIRAKFYQVFSSFIAELVLCFIKFYRVLSQLVLDKT